MGKRRKNYLEIINNILKKHWVWYTFLIATPTIWFSVVVPYFGTFLKLVNDNGNLTKLGIILSILLCIIDFSIILINNWYSSKTEVGKLRLLKGEIAYLRTISENIDRICDEKSTKLISNIYDVKNQGIEAAKIISNPSNQLKRIIIGITDCLVKLMDTGDINYEFKDFTVSLVYNFPLENNDWEWIEGINDKGDIANELFRRDCKSTFNHLINSHEPFYFNNKKEEAKEKDCYYYNPQDKQNSEMNEPIGSIFCYSFKITKSKKTYINAMLSISTQKKRFSESMDESKCKNVRDNLISLVKDSFGKRIKIELSLLYLEYLQNKLNSVNDDIVS